MKRRSVLVRSPRFYVTISSKSMMRGPQVGGHKTAVSLSSLGRATSAARGVGRSIKESQDVGRAQETVAAINEQMSELDTQFKGETEALEQTADSQTETFETTVVKPTKANITVKLFSLAWAPYWHDAQGQTTPAWT